MEIMLNEVDWVEDVIRRNNLGKKPFMTFKRVARYYFDNGMSESDVKNNLFEFLIKCDNNASKVLWEPTIDSAIKYAKKNKLINIKEIPITESELSAINSISKKQTRRLAFSLLVLSKYWDCVNDTDTHWVNTKYNDVMKLSNINTSIKRQCAMYSELRDLGFVRFSRKVNNTSTQVLFADDSSPVVINVNMLKNLGYQYQKYLGEPYYVCELCGVTEKIKNPKKGRPPKYCDSCAVKMRIKQNIDSVMKHRK